ncbi:VOC family protein [uncultured Tateyamaria sp.]|uniref:VOC family protein n=1 Tax=uncultured Tateyamaria sp. TaxID=455651 RepID=UPI00260E4190|nr:VOC family protein [uncultured Tateyamaria sp.]
MIFDHLVVGAITLAEAQGHIENALGLPMQPGGQHSVFHTHNALMGLEDGLYLEAIAPDPDAPPPARPCWYDLDRFEGPARLSNWACAVDDLDKELSKMPDGCGAPVKVTRGALHWHMAVSDQGTTPFDNLWPALLQWPAGIVHPATRLAPTGIRLRRLTLVHPEAERLADALTRHLDDPRVAFETGSVAMQAVFDTPHGQRTL